MIKIEPLKFNSRLPLTKRYLFNPLLRFIEYCKEKPFSRDTVMGIAGPRHCGKTTLLMQLCEECKRLGFNTMFKTYTDGEEYSSLWDDVINSNIDVLFIDEICKASNRSQIKFCSDVRNLQNIQVITIYTGSAPKVLESLSASIGRGSILTLPMITYCEYLQWNNSIDEFNNSLFNISSNDLLMLYLKTSTGFIEHEKINSYISSCVEDTVSSYLCRFKESYDNFTKDNLDDFIHYLAVKQILPKKIFYDIKNYGDIPDSVNKYLQSINDKVKLINNSLKKSMEDVLIDSDLLLETFDYDGYNSAAGVCFSYPWLIVESIKRKDLIENIKPLDDIWVEAALLSRLSYIYNMAGKYRHKETLEEIDVVYCDDGFIKHAVEIKNSAYSNASKRQIKARSAFDELKTNSLYFNSLSEYLFTYSYLDNPNQRNVSVNSISNHILMLALDLYYIYVSSLDYLLTKEQLPSLFNNIPDNCGLISINKLLKVWGLIRT